MNFAISRKTDEHFILVSNMSVPIFIMVLLMF